MPTINKGISIRAPVERDFAYVTDPTRGPVVDGKP